VKALPRQLRWGLLVLAALAQSVTLGAQPKSAWHPLLDPTLSQWEVFTGVPLSTVTRLPTGYSRAGSAAAQQPVGLGDPFKLFTVQRASDGQLVLRVSGEVYAGLTSRAQYANYHLTFEVRWGTTKWAPRLTEKRDSGLLYHCQGPHGAFWKVWMPCLELQIQEGDFGDLHQLAGPSSAVRQVANTWNPSGTLVRTDTRVLRRTNRESPPGEWTRVDLYVVGDRAVHVVNGVVVLALQDARKADGQPLTSGMLQLQSEGAECFYRDLRWRRIMRLPQAVADQVRDN
jgi:hypothetical protein